METTKQECTEHWQVVEEREVFAYEPWMRIFMQDLRLPSGKIVHNFGRIQLSDFIVVFAQTKGGKIIVERQYKQGVGFVSLMFPAGIIEPGEEALEAAQRELLEETGYQSGHWQSMGSYVSNGNYGCGTAHFFLATGAEKVTEADSGDLEDMEILFLTEDEVLEALADGRVTTVGAATVIGLAKLVLSGSLITTGRQSGNGINKTLASGSQLSKNG